MNSLLIKPSKLSGTVIAPPSKSLSHRAVICASLSNDGGISTIDNVILSDDITATIEGMRQLGASIEISENRKNNYCLKISGGSTVKNAAVDCKESGSTLRFLIPISLMLSEECTFTGRGKLVERPLDIYYKLFKEHGIDFTNNKGLLPLTVSGKLSGGSYEMSGTVSSQFISGLLFSLPLAKGNSIIQIPDKMESVGYIDLTLKILKKFNINIENNNYREFKIYGDSLYKSSDYTVEGDYSQAAFFLTARAIGNDVECTGLNKDSLQGDKEITDVIKRFEAADGEIIIDASQIPDLVPIMTVLGALKDGVTTRIINAERLRIKESDRLKAIATEMNKLGANVTELTGGLLIKGQEYLEGNATVDSWNDHRIAMSLAIAATRCRHEIRLENHMAVNKSYPEFWNDYKSVGGDI